MAKCWVRKLDIVLEDYHAKIRHRSRGLVNMPKIEICVIGSSIISEGSDISSEDQMLWESQHTGGINDIPKDKVMFWRFG